jgi:glycosyltransferase involved in cell wall biosynthesis
LQKEPKISIIIPNYNHQLFLKERLLSVFNQSFQDFEVILLDDASSDNSVEILNDYKNHPKVVHFIVNKENSGSPFRQWKKGIELAKGEYIWIAESDDCCQSTFLEELLRHETNEIGLLYAQSYDIDEMHAIIFDRLNYTAHFKPNIWESDFKLKGSSFIHEYFLDINVIPNASAVIFKKALVNQSTFSESLLKMRMCGDWLFWIKLTSKTHVSFVNQHLNYFRNHSTTSRNHDSKQKKKLRLKEEAIIRSYVSKELNIVNQKKDAALYKKWFKNFKVSQVFNKEIKEIKMHHTSYASFYLQYFNQKIK